MSQRRCVGLCDRSITAEDTHDRCMLSFGRHHAQAALSGLSNCQYYCSLRLKVLRVRLAAFSKGLASNPHQSVSAVAEAPHETIAWDNACESEHMEGEMLEYSLFLVLSPGHVQELEECYVEPVVFVNDDSRPTLETRSTVSFICEPHDNDVLSTAASDSEDLIADSCSSLPPSGQEKCNSPSYSELLDVVTSGGQIRIRLGL